MFICMCVCVYVYTDVDRVGTCGYGHGCGCWCGCGCGVGMGKGVGVVPGTKIMRRKKARNKGGKDEERQNASVISPFGVANDVTFLFLQNMHAMTFKTKLKMHQYCSSAQCCLSKV